MAKKSIIHSKWYAVFEVVTTLAVMGLAVFMVMNSNPGYENVERSYTNLVDDIRVRNTAKNRYMLFAEQAGMEENYALQRLFAAAADGETVIIDREFEMINSISERTMPVGDSAEAKSTGENLIVCISDLKDRADSVYPRYMAVAQEESYEDAEELFDMCGRAARSNSELFVSVQTEGAADDTGIYLCEECAALTAGDRPEICSICGKNKIKEY